MRRTARTPMAARAPWPAVRRWRRRRRQLHTEGLAALDDPREDGRRVAADLVDRREDETLAREDGEPPVDAVGVTAHRVECGELAVGEGHRPLGKEGTAVRVVVAAAVHRPLRAGQRQLRGLAPHLLDGLGAREVDCLPEGRGWVPLEARRRAEPRCAHPHARAPRHPALLKPPPRHVLRHGLSEAHHEHGQRRRWVRKAQGAPEQWWEPRRREV